MLLSEADRLDMLKAVGAEEFDTGKPDRLWAVFEGGFLTLDLAERVVESRETWLEARLSDVEAHELVKGSRITRVKDGKDYLVRRDEPDESSGFTVIRLSK